MAALARMQTMAALDDQIVDAFRQNDARGRGTISRSELLQVFQVLGGGSWAEGDVGQLLEGLGATGNSDEISYEDFVRWIMDAPDGPVDNNKVCQAAFEGKLDAVKELHASLGSEGIRGSVGYIVQSGLLTGMWTMIPNTFQLKAVKDDPEILPASALHWAAFGGKSEVVSYLISECGMIKDDEGSFGWLPFAIAGSHRLLLGGECVTDATEVQGLLEDDDMPLPAETLDMKATFRGGLNLKLGAEDTAEGAS